MKRLIIFLLVLIMAFSLGACTGTVTEDSGNQQGGSGKGDDTIIYAFWNPPSGVLQPLLVDDEYDGAILKFAFDTLLSYDKELNLVPNMAEYTMSEDQTVLTFVLKEGIKWHDGEPLTAEDVAFTFNSMASPDYTGPRYGDVEGIKGAKAFHNGEADKVEGITVIDERTVEFEFEHPFAPGLTKIGADRAIIPKHIWEEIPIGEWDKQTELMNMPIGCGPFKMKENVSGQYIALEAFPEYFKGAPETKNVIFKVSNQDTVVAELINGEIDVADISSLKTQDLKTLKESNVKVISYTGVTSQYMGMNLRESKFQDIKVRQAITYAIDRKLMVDKLLEGRAKVMDAPLLPNSWAYPEAGVLNEYDFNPDKSKELLKEAGWEDRNGDGVIENANGEAFKVSLKYPQGNKIREQSAPIIQASLKEVGIEVELQIMDFATLLDEVMANHQFDMYLMGSSLDTDPDPKPIWHTDSSSDEPGNSAWNIVAYRNPAADKAMDDALKTVDVKIRKDLYKEFCLMVNEDCPEVLLYAPDITMAYNSRLQNYSPSTFNDFYDREKWVIK